MPDNRLPKHVLYSQLARGTRHRGGQKKHFRDVLKRNLTLCKINTDTWEELALDRNTWRASTQQGILHLEEQRRSYENQKRLLRKERSKTTSNSSTDNSSMFNCRLCNRTCASKIGLLSHLRSHRS